MYSFLPGAKYSANYGDFNRRDFERPKRKARKKSVSIAKPSRSRSGTPSGTPVKETPNKARRQSVAQIVINKATNKFRARWKRKMETSLQDYDLPKSKR